MTNGISSRAATPSTRARALSSSTAAARGIAAVCIAVATLVWFVMLNGRALYDPDEGRYAEIPREMLLDHDWIVPHLNGLIYLEKPPLQYWLTAASLRLLGDTEFAARLCPGIAGFLSMIIVFALGKRLWGREAGLRAVLLAGASTLFVLLGHQLTLDMMLTLWLLAALACLLMAQTTNEDHRRRRGWMLGCWAAMALAVLTKGLIGLIAPAATVLLHAAWRGDRRILERLDARWGVPLFALLVLPWFILAARANPAFLEFFIVREHFARFLTPIELRTEPWWFFCAVLPVGILPWAPLAARSIVTTASQRMPRGHFDAAGLLLVWCVFLFVFFSCSNAKLIPYVLPIVPALALLCARPDRGVRPNRGNRFCVAAGAALTLFAGASIIITANSSWHWARAAFVFTEARVSLSFTGALLAVAALGTGELLRRGRDLAGLTVLCAAWFLASAGITVGATAAQGAFSARSAARLLKSVASPAAPVFSVQLYDQTLPFYLGRTVTLVSYRDEFALGLDQEPARGIADTAAFAALWQSLPQGYAVMRPSLRDALLAQGVPMREVGRFRNRVIESRR